MKHLSKALVALSLFAASAAHAQTSLYGTTFDGPSTVAYPYTDGTVYGGNFDDLNNVGAWSSSEGSTYYADTVADTSGNIVAQLYSGNGTAFASHALSSPAYGGGYTFTTDFQIANNGVDGTGAANPGNEFSFSLTNTAGTVATLNFVPSGTTGGVENAYTPELVVNGVTVGTATTGPVTDELYHLTISVSRTGDIVASLGTPGSTITATDLDATAVVTGFSVGETDTSAATGTDYVAFDNISLTVPEPSTYAMMGLGLAGMLGLMKFRRTKA